MIAAEAPIGIAGMTLKKKVLIGFVCTLALVGVVTGIAVGLGGSENAQTASTQVDQVDTLTEYSAGASAVISTTCRFNTVTGVSTVSNLGSVTGCVVRTDTFEAAKVVEGVANFNSRITGSLELYTTATTDASGNLDCVDFLGTVSC
jgi:hypothetical protein